MWKALKVATIVCGLLIVHGQQAHAAWAQMYGNSNTDFRVGWVQNHADYLPCRVYYAGGIHPGWTSWTKGFCAFGWGGVEHDSYVYQVWVDDWQPATYGNVPANAIPLGYEYTGGQPSQALRYACQAIGPSGRLLPGKVAPNIAGCDFADGGVEQHATSYNVLVDSSLAMTDDTGIPKISVNTAPANFIGFTSTYYISSAIGNNPPDGAVFGGTTSDGTSYFPLCSEYFLDGYQVGYEDAFTGGCTFSWGGQSYLDTGISYVGPAQNWTNNGSGNLAYYYWGTVPVDYQLPYDPLAYPGGLFQSAIIGGNEADGTHLYICAGYTGNIPGWPAMFTPGKVRPGLGGCSVAVNGQEIIVSTYEVLTETYTTPYS